MSEISAAPRGRAVDADAVPWVPVWRDRVAIALVYALAWGILNVNRGFYWDDWTLVGVAPSDLIHTFTELGMPWIGYFYAALLALPLPALVGHVVVFWTYLLAAMMFHAVLCRIPGLSRLDALVAALAFAVLPVNYARVAMIDLTYGLCLAAFLTATWMLVRYVAVGGIGLRLAALGLFIISFSTASMLVMFVVPLALAGGLVWHAGKVPVRSFAIRHLDFVLLPVVYWVVKSTFFSPSGVYSGYNALTVPGLLAVPSALLATPDQVLVEPIYRAVSVAGIPGLVAGGALAGWLLWRSRAPEGGERISALVLAAAGVALVGLGVSAYLAVGRVPTIWDWSSRHQLLVPLGAALLAAAVMRGVHWAGRAGPVFGVVVGMVLGIAIVADARTLVAYQIDWYKQVAFMDTVRDLPDVRAAHHIRIVDQTRGLDALRRRIRFYEYNALLSQAFGDTSRLASEGSDEPAPDELAGYIARPAYHMDRYIPSSIDLELLIGHDGQPPDVLEVARLVVAEALGWPSFEHDVSRMVDLTPVQLPGSVVSP